MSNSNIIFNHISWSTNIVIRSKMYRTIAWDNGWWTSTVRDGGAIKRTLGLFHFSDLN